MKKIPDNAKKVFQGALFDVYQWDQEMFDGTKDTFEAIKRKDSVTVIAVTDDGKIIVNHEMQPNKDEFTSFPGGGVEKGEVLLESAKRELLEETGYASDEWEEWFAIDPLDIKKIEWTVTYFIAKGCKKVKNPVLDNGEKIETELYTFDQFIELRHDMKSRNKDIAPYLDKVAEDEEEKKKLQALLGIAG
jgi:ADP-ribose pyrophosphatase